MKNNDVKNIVAYWMETAKHDYQTMISLFDSKRYSDSLFYGHLVIEKILKAIVVLKSKEHPKPTHNLLFLLQLAGTEIRLTKEEMEFLTEINKFNIKARYPDYKLSFYKLCTLKYTYPRLEKIKLFYKKLCVLCRQ